MLPLIQQLQEQSEESNDRPYRSVARTILRGMKSSLPILSQYPVGKWLYRGVTSTEESGMVTIANCPTNRKPRDSAIEWHEALGDFMVHKFGINFRENAFFTTSNKKVAQGYGSTMFFFPLGKTTYLWNTMVDDPLNEFGRRGTTPEDLQHQDWVAGGYVTSNLARAMETGYEVMMHCDQALLIDTYIPDDTIAQIAIELKDQGVFFPHSRPMENMHELLQIVRNHIC